MAGPQRYGRDVMAPRLRGNLIQTLISGGCAKQGDDGRHDQPDANQQEDENWPGTCAEGVQQVGDVPSKQEDTHAAAKMPKAISQREAGRSRSRGIVFGGPSVGHRHPQVEAKERDDGPNRGQGEIAGREGANQNAADDGQHRRDRQPQLALQPLTKEVSEDGAGKEPKRA